MPEWICEGMRWAEDVWAEQEIKKMEEEEV